MEGEIIENDVKTIVWTENKFIPRISVDRALIFSALGTVRLGVLW